MAILRRGGRHRVAPACPVVLTRLAGAGDGRERRGEAARRRTGSRTQLQVISNWLGVSRRETEPRDRASIKPQLDGGTLAHRLARSWRRRRKAASKTRRRAVSPATRTLRQPPPAVEPHARSTYRRPARRMPRQRPGRPPHRRSACSTCRNACVADSRTSTARLVLSLSLALHSASRCETDA